MIIWRNLIFRSWNSGTPAPQRDGQTIPVTDPARYTTPGSFCGDWPMFREPAAAPLPERGQEGVHIIDIIEVPLNDPAAASYLRFEPASDPDEDIEHRHSCHDTGVILDDINLVACAGSGGPGNGGSVYSMDPAMGGSTDNPLERTWFFLDASTGASLGQFTLPRPQTNVENCTTHNWNTVPTAGAYVMVSGNYQSGISVFDFTNPANAQEIASG